MKKETASVDPNLEHKNFLNDKENNSIKREQDKFFKDKKRSLKKNNSQVPYNKKRVVQQLREEDLLDYDENYIS